MFKDGEETSEKKSTARFINNVFILMSLVRFNGLSVKKKTTEESMKQKLEIKNILSTTVLNLIQIKNLDLSEYFLICYPNLKDFRLFILQYTKKKMIKMYILVISFFTG